jgi:helicase
MQSTGDFDRADPWLRNVDLIISTNEKLDSLLRHRASWLSDVRLLVSDEVHLIGDMHRGPTLEIVLTRLQQDMEKVRIIALSATITNAGQIAQWLGAKLIRSDWRPVPLREGVYFDGAVIFNDGTVIWTTGESGIDVIDPAIDTIRERGQALLFVNTRKSAEAVAGKAAAVVAKLLNKDERAALAKMADKLSSAASEPTKVAKKLSEQVAHGVAFHHAGLLASQRKLIEDAFRENKIKLLAATTTLAMGLNLPSRRVIIRDWRRYESGTGMVPITVLEVKQMSGRAGRPGFDEYGEAVLIAGNKRDERILFERYIKGKPEDVRSRIGSESALRTHVLASIAGGFARRRDDLAQFLGQTLFALQNGAGMMISLADKILAFLIQEALVAEKAGLTATRFGRRISELYIDPLSGIMLRESLTSETEIETFGLLHMIARTPDMMKLQLRQSDIDRMLPVFHANAGRLLIPDKEVYATEEMLSEIKTASLLAEWIDETPEEGITSAFGVGPGDIHTAADLADWLLYSAYEIARIFKREDARKALGMLRTRLMYGVKEELLPLVAIRGVGRVRARNLFKAGYSSPKEIASADARDLEKVPAIGRAVAEDIKNQANALAA